MSRSLIAVFLLSAIIINLHAKPIDPAKIVLALNCGSKEEAVTSAQNNFKYQPDSQYVKGASVDVDYQANTQAVQAQIKYTFQKEVYMYERHTYQQMSYLLPIKKGPHTLILKFAQMYFRNRGQRVFNIKIGDTIVIQNFDVIQRSGSKYSAHQQYLPIDVRKDGVYFNGNKINSAIQEGKLKLSFAKGKADNPIIQGIIVYADSIQNSPKQQFETMKNKWNSQQQMLKAKKQQAHLRQLIAIQKKKERIVIRNDQLLLQEQKKSESGSSQPAQKFGLIRKVLMGPIGIILWTLVFGYKFYFIYKNIFKMEAQKVKSE